MISVVRDYFQFERAIGLDLAARLAPKRASDSRQWRMLDVGCGYGGVLQGLAEKWPDILGVGIDLDPNMIAAGKPQVSSSIQLECGDFLNMPPAQFDLVCMRDVLEHIGDSGLALEKALSYLSPGGWLYITFAPFEGPFGGHQQNGSGIAAWIPWLHLLPTSLFLRALHVQGNSYKAKSQLDADMHSVLTTRLTERAFLKALKPHPLHLEFRRRYLSRPEYRHKLALPAISIPNGFPLGSVFTTGIEVLAQKK